MPLYEYKCTKCGSSFEIIQKVSDQPYKKCPNCGEYLKKIISAPALQFKGSGWYVTDYGHKGEKEKEPRSLEKPKKESAKDKKPSLPSKDKSSD